MAPTSTLPLLLLLSTTHALSSSSQYQFDPLEHLTGISPYFQPADPPLDPTPPPGCSVSRAAYLVRHAAIYANDFDYETYIEPFLSKLANYTRDKTVDWKQAEELSFLATWSSPIKKSDEEKLTKVGQMESFELGVKVEQRYPTLKQPKKVWASTAERTVKSAKAFMEGLEKEEGASELVEVYEGKQDGADSLTPYKSCPGYSSSRGSEQSKTFQTKYTAPIIARLNDNTPGINFTLSDIVAMQQLCGYETVIRGSSPFCSLELFRADDWLSFEYANDLQYFHNAGYGNPLSGFIGWPWVNATSQLLLASNTSSNDTQDLYVSFTHRETPPAVLVALGLFNNTAFLGGDVNATMPLTRINHRRAWKASHILPFLSNIAIERLECDAHLGYAPGQYFRVLVNQSPQPLEECVDGPGESCSRAGFEAYLGERSSMFEGFGEKCGVDYKNSTDVLSVYTK